MASNMQSGEQQLLLSLVAYILVCIYISILVFVDKKGFMVSIDLGVHSRGLQPSLIPMLNNRTCGDHKSVFFSQVPLHHITRSLSLEKNS